MIAIAFADALSAAKRENRVALGRSNEKERKKEREKISPSRVVGVPARFVRGDVRGRVGTYLRALCTRAYTPVCARARLTVERQGLDISYNKL